MMGHLPTGFKSAGGTRRPRENRVKRAAAAVRSGKSSTGDGSCKITSQRPGTAADRGGRMVFRLPASVGGEKFLRWIKSCKEKTMEGCLKKSNAQKTIVNSGEKHFSHRRILSWHRRC